MKRRNVAVKCAALTAACGLALAGCGSYGDEPTPAPAPAEETQTRETSEDREASQENERADLVDFALDDRSQAGFTNIWVTWTVRNGSSEVSDYVWTWEAVDSTGTRVANSTEYVTDVRPGQTATGESPTTLDTTEVDINVTDFDRFTN
ncbi:hypothetical protein CUT44_31570 [Streptomyces carminius]|uniref:Lipoprotein n=1 Tax=Streptomyces carminius TaxID=2665496 RepID=A0A2M8LP72_9ACTN|nr:hypothetical protein [Streptomyces carminius]PJE93757.1 hypothetical protein CUT44_31570 [Streptomyces carminius]